MAINNLAGSTEQPEKDSQTNEKIKKGGPVNLVLMALLVIVLATGTLMFFQKGKVVEKTTQMDADIKTIKDQTAQLKGQKVEFSKNATEFLNTIQADELRWSEVIGAVNQLLPTDASTGEKKVNVLSYSGSGEGRIALNMVTVPASIPAYADVSRLIASFNNSIFFKDAYVPSISKGSNTDGNTTLSFVLNLSYKKQETGDNALTLPVVSTGTSSVVTDSTKVPVNSNSKVARPSNQ